MSRRWLSTSRRWFCTSLESRDVGSQRRDISLTLLLNVVTLVLTTLWNVVTLDPTSRRWMLSSLERRDVAPEHRDVALFKAKTTFILLIPYSLLAYTLCRPPAPPLAGVRTNICRRPSFFPQTPSPTLPPPSPSTPPSSLFLSHAIHTTRWCPCLG